MFPAESKKKLLEQATTAIESVVDFEYPDFSSSLFCNLGHGFISVGAFDEALVSCQAAAEIDPENYEAWFNQGRILSKLERKREALTAYDTAIAIEPDHYAAWNNKGH